MVTEASTNGNKGPQRTQEEAPFLGPRPTDSEQLSPQLQGGGSSTEASWHLPQLFMEPQLSPKGGGGEWNWGRECIMAEGENSRRGCQDLAFRHLGPIILRRGCRMAVKFQDGH